MCIYFVLASSKLIYYTYYVINLFITILNAFCHINKINSIKIIYATYICTYIYVSTLPTHVSTSSNNLTQLI